MIFFIVIGVAVVALTIKDDQEKASWESYKEKSRGPISQNQVCEIMFYRRYAAGRKLTAGPDGRIEYK